MALRLLALAAIAAQAAASHVYIIEDGQCGESRVQRIFLQFALRSREGLTEGRCRDAGYTEEIGTVQVDSGNRMVGTIETTMYIQPGANPGCTVDQLQQLTDACASFASPDDPAVCGTPCADNAASMRGESECTVQGSVEEMLNTLVATCSGMVEVGTGAAVDADGFAMEVGEGDRCAIGYCESSDCPMCSNDLQCQAPGRDPLALCAGTCWGECVRREEISCSTCTDLGWRLTGDSDTVCAESDDGFACTTGIVFSEAEETCMLAGARLCTADELIAREGQGTGCGHDNRLVWSSSVSAASGGATACSPAERLAVMGNYRGRDHDVSCVDVQEATPALRCCADTVCQSATVAAPETMTLFETVASMPETFSTLGAAVTAAGLADTLNGEGPFTVFAPTDDAFAALGQDTINALLADPAQLASILTYHVATGERRSFELSDHMKLRTANGAALRILIDAASGAVTVRGSQGSARVIQADVLCSNGVAHVIDAVLLPPAGGH